MENRYDTIMVINPIWKHRLNSNMIKWLMSKSDCTLEDISNGLGCGLPYANNKLHRNSFSIRDLIIVAHMCGYSLGFIGDDLHSNEIVKIDAEEYLSVMDPDALSRLSEHTKKTKSMKQVEYDELKKVLEKMKTKYELKD